MDKRMRVGFLLVAITLCLAHHGIAGKKQIQSLDGKWLIAFDPHNE